MKALRQDGPLANKDLRQDQFSDIFSGLVLKVFPNC